MGIGLILALVSITLLVSPSLRRQYKLKRWRKALALDKHVDVFHRLFVNVNGFGLSREARARHDALEYLYGEIDFIPFIALLSLAKPNNNTVFYDLGSGVGKAVFACAMVFNVKKSCGIELFNGLHDCALQKQQELRQHPDYRQAVDHIFFMNDNFLQADFNDATLIFINATAFIGETWATLNKRLAIIPTNITIITTSKKLSSTAFTVSMEVMVQMSWGPVQAYIQQKHIA